MLIIVRSYGAVLLASVQVTEFLPWSVFEGSALLVDRAGLEGYPDEHDVVMANRTLKPAYNTDVLPILTMVRQRCSGAIDPVVTYRNAEYRAQVAQTLPASKGSCGGIL
tara:strand:- start:294 stop:620 length:327 start_codon:yes stop_codon:yes gene_type:complete